MPNTGVGLSCSLNSSADGRLGTLMGAAGARKLDSSCANGPKIKQTVTAAAWTMGSMGSRC